MPIEDYQADLETAPDDELKRKLELLRIAPDKFAELPSIVVEKQRNALRINSREGFSVARMGDAKAHSSELQPEDLHTLKELTGVPQRAFEAGLDNDYESRRSAKLRRQHDQIVAKLPPRSAFAKLNTERKAAVWGVATDLLYGPVSDSTLDRPGYKRVVEHMLDIAKLTLFVAPDLVVADGQSVVFSNYAVLYFTNVNVYGSGAITLGDQTKLHAHSIKHL